MRYSLLLILLLTQVNGFAQATVKWRFHTKDASFGQSAAADIDGDGKLEIVFGCYRNDSMIYALNAENGSLLWKFNAKGGAEGCNDVAPIIYDVDGDGKLEVIVPSSCNPKTFCFDGKTGSLKWTCTTRGSDSPPTIADIDGDGKAEIIHGEFGGYVLCINAEDGSVAWEIAVDTKSWIQTAPTILDADGDGNLDFIVASWNASNKADNKVYAYRAKDQKLLWTRALSDVVYHGTAVGDLDNDGKPELLIGCYNDTLYCLNAKDGSTKWTYSVGKYFYVGGPAQIADLDNDGSCEVVFSAWYSVLALRANGSKFWQYDIPNYKQSFRGAAIADINNNAYPDVVFGTDGGSVIALNGEDGTLIFNKNLRSDYGDSLYALDHAPLVADFDKDGNIDVFIVGGHAEYPDFYKDFGRAYMLSVGKGRGPDWLMFQNDIRRQSTLCGKKPSDISELKSAISEAHLFPHPNCGKGQLRFYADQAGTAEIEVSDLFGKPVYRKNLSRLLPGEQTIDLSLPENCSSGLYLCRITLGRDSRVLKWVLE